MYIQSFMIKKNYANLGYPYVLWNLSFTFEQHQYRDGLTDLAVRGKRTRNISYLLCINYLVYFFQFLGPKFDLCFEKESTSISENTKKKKNINKLYKTHTSWI